MSFSGQSPTAKRLRYTPQSTDPVNPTEGDFFYSDGTPRARGPWVYLNTGWTQVSTSGSLNTVNSITFTPQAVTPTVGPSDAGMVFYSNGGDRAEGLWLYNGSSWIQLSGLKYQEFYMKDYIVAKAATSVSDGNITNINTKLRSGQTIDGVTLATNDYVLLTLQTSASENGVYKVLAAADPATVARAPEADTVAELTDCAVTVSAGAINRNTSWFQTATLTSLSDPQTWSQTIAAKTFTVPADVYAVDVLGSGGGGGGGPSRGAASNNATHGGGGGAGAPICHVSIPVTPGQTLTITLGKGGAGSAQTAYNVTPADALPGDATTITGTNVNLYFPGATFGAAGIAVANQTQVDTGGRTLADSTFSGLLVNNGGDGGEGRSGTYARTAGQNGCRSVLAATPAAGGAAASGSATYRGGSGGGGGNSVGIGGAGAQGGSAPFKGASGSNGNKGAGGGGAAGGANLSPTATDYINSGFGGPGYVKISWG